MWSPADRKQLHVAFLHDVLDGRLAGDVRVLEYVSLGVLLEPRIGFTELPPDFGWRGVLCVNGGS